MIPGFESCVGKLRRAEITIGRWGYPEGIPAPDLPDDLERYFPICVAIGGLPLFDDNFDAWGWGAAELLGWCLAAAWRTVDLFGPCFLNAGEPAGLRDLEDDVPLTWFA